MENTDAAENWFDDDIAAMNLGYGEKAGLQIYRNYTKAFEEDAIKRFVETIDCENLDISDFQNIANLIANEEARFLPVIVCAFADDILKETFKSVLPDGIPEGKASMLSGFGPLATLSKRIQLAYAFDIFSTDLMQEINRLRETRNNIAHSWNLNEFGDYFAKGRLADMYRMEELLPEHAELASEFAGGFGPLAGFRCVWSGS